MREIVLGVRSVPVGSVRILTFGLLVAMSIWSSAAWAISDSQKCEIQKLKISGKYYFCNLKAAAKTVRTGDTTDSSVCDAAFAEKWSAAELAAPGLCPTNGDQSAIQSKIAADASSIPQSLAGPRFVDNGDGTVTDTQTRLIWEKKDDYGGIHDVTHTYGWSADASYTPNGTAFANFLYVLNDGRAPCCATSGPTSGCFTGHCDWRLPLVEELVGIFDPRQGICGGGSGPCIDPIFGLTQSYVPDGGEYLTATTDQGNASLAVTVIFDNGPQPADVVNKFGGAVFVRAVRGPQ